MRMYVCVSEQKVLPSLDNRVPTCSYVPSAVLDKQFRQLPVASWSGRTMGGGGGGERAELARALTFGRYGNYTNATRNLHML